MDSQRIALVTGATQGVDRAHIGVRTTTSEPLSCAACQGFWRSPIASGWRGMNGRMPTSPPSAVSEDFVVVDTHGSAAAGRVALADLDSLGVGHVTHVVNSHWHWDHTFGNVAFRDAVPDVPIHAHVEAARWLSEHGQRMKQRFADFPDDAHREDVAATEIVIPDKTFTETHVLDLGDRIIELLFLGRGHTSGDIVTRVVDADVVAAADLIEESAKPWIGLNSWPLEWPATLDLLLEFDDRSDSRDSRTRDTGRSRVPSRTARRDRGYRRDRPAPGRTRCTRRTRGCRRRLAVGGGRPYPQRHQAGIRRLENRQPPHQRTSITRSSRARFHDLACVSKAEEPLWFGGSDENGTRPPPADSRHS